MERRAKMMDFSVTMILVILFLAANDASLLAHAISCQDALVQMMPCQAFLLGVGEITAPCCEHALRLSQLANSTPEVRKSMCKCFKQVAMVLGINVDRAKQIPQLCRIDLSVGLIDPSVNCNRLNFPTWLGTESNEIDWVQEPQALTPAGSHETGHLHKPDPLCPANAPLLPPKP